MSNSHLLLLTASFAPISFAIKAKENDMLPLEKNRVRLDDDDDDEEGKVGFGSLSRFGWSRRLMVYVFILACVLSFP